MSKNISRKRRARRVRAKIAGTAKCPRMTIFRSLAAIYVQIIDDEAGKTLVAYDTRALEGGRNDLKAAEAAGAQIAKLALAKKIGTVVFDRQG